MIKGDHVHTEDRIFRYHHAAPANVRSPLCRHLTEEWANLHALTSTRTTVRRWARQHEVLSDLTTPGDIVDTIDAGSTETKNESLLALLRLFQDGQQLAGRTVLQALLPKLTQIATRATNKGVSSVEVWFEDRYHITLAECWDVMATYPVDRRTTSVAANLTLDTLHRVTGSRREFEIPVEPHDINAVESVGSFPDRPGGTRDAARRALHYGTAAIDPYSPRDHLTPDGDLPQLLTWALHHDVVNHDEAQLIAACYLPEQTTGFGFAQAAEDHGLTQVAIRKRCSRITRKIADAVRTELPDTADTPDCASSNAA